MASMKIMSLAQLIKQSIGMLDSPQDDDAIKIVAQASQALLKLAFESPQYNPVPVAPVGIAHQSDPTGEGFVKTVLATMDKLLSATTPPLNDHLAVHQCAEQVTLEHVKDVYDSMDAYSAHELIVTSKGQQDIPDNMSDGSTPLAGGFERLLTAVVAGLRVDDVPWDVKYEEASGDSESASGTDPLELQDVADLVDMLPKPQSAHTSAVPSAGAAQTSTVVRDQDPAVAKVLENTPPEVVCAVLANEDDDSKDAVSTAVCKKAIVSKLNNNPMTVCNVIGVSYDPEVEEAALVLKNWKRVSKSGPKKACQRVFTCEGYDGKLKAEVCDDGTTITDITFKM